MSMVLRSDAAGVATLTLNRPEKLNVLNPATFHELRGHLDAIAGDTAVRCVVLTGAGRSFWPGHDLDRDRLRRGSRASRCSDRRPSTPSSR